MVLLKPNVKQSIVFYVNLVCSPSESIHFQIINSRNDALISEINLEGVDLSHPDSSSCRKLQQKIVADIEKLLGRNSKEEYFNCKFIFNEESSAVMVMNDAFAAGVFFEKIPFKDFPEHKKVFIEALAIFSRRDF